MPLFATITHVKKFKPTPQRWRT